MHCEDFTRGGECMMNHELEAWIEPSYQPPIPVVEPLTLLVPEKIIFMPFPKKARDFWMRVAGDKCQTLVYDEVYGWRTCGRPAQEVDHIIPESQLLYEHKDPNNSVGIPRCLTHHRGDGRDEDGEIAGYGDWNWSKHPDLADALDAYRAGDSRAFEKMGRAHCEAAENGERYWNTDWSVDELETELMKQLVQKSGEKRPTVKPHPKFNGK